MRPRNKIAFIAVVLTLSLAALSKYSSEPTRVYNLETGGVDPQPGRKHICTMTLNSDSEKNEFIRHSRQVGEEVDYVEIVPENPVEPRNGWLQASCDLLEQKRIVCDELILSSHFGPRLYGDRGKDLDLDFLESLSCSQTRFIDPTQPKVCANLFNHLKKTYLFACNTLSGKGNDHRDYTSILIGDGAARSWAEEASASRYGKYGSGGSFGDRFMRVFSNAVPGSEIYGFTSVSQLGKDNAVHIRKHFQSGIPLEKIMAPKNMIKVAGQLDSRQAHIRDAYCQLSSYDLFPDKVIGNVVDYYLSADPRTGDPHHRELYPRMIHFIMDHYTNHHSPHESTLGDRTFAHLLQTRGGSSYYDRLKGNAELRDFVLEALRSNALPSSTRMSWGMFAARLKWITDPELNAHLTKGLFGLMRPPYGPQIRTMQEDVTHFAKIYPGVTRTLRKAQMPAACQTHEVQSLLRDLHEMEWIEDAAMRDWLGAR